MARVVSVVGVTHHPFYLHLSSLPADQRPPFLAPWATHLEEVRSRIAAARPDVLVVVGNDHFHQFFLDNIPAFLIGSMPSYDGTYRNEIREFHIPEVVVPGHVPLSDHLLEAGLDSGIDLAFSNELRLDHSIVMPLLTLVPGLDVPIVPVLTNCFAPPMPRPARFVEVGRILRKALDAYPEDARVVVLSSAHFSLELGGPKQFGDQGPSPEFDAQALGWLARQDIAAAVEGSTHDALFRAGNASFGFLNLLLAMGLAGDSVKPSYCEGLQVFATMEGFVVWDLEATT